MDTLRFAHETLRAARYRPLSADEWALAITIDTRRSYAVPADLLAD